MRGHNPNVMQCAGLQRAAGADGPFGVGAAARLRARQQVRRLGRLPPAALRRRGGRRPARGADGPVRPRRQRSPPRPHRDRGAQAHPQLGHGTAPKNNKKIIRVSYQLSCAFSTNANSNLPPAHHTSKLSYAFSNANSNLTPAHHTYQISCAFSN
eukprot:515766-Prorocentrum_minimum.AAC.1